MSAEAALAWADALVFSSTGTPLTELQRTILQQVWQGQRYLDIAQHYGCTEGHAKDTGADLWHLMSAALGEKVSKRNYRTVALRYCLDTVPEPQPPPKDILNIQPNFVGRRDAIAHLKALEERGVKAIVIQGEGGLGKTTLAQQYLQHQNFEQVLELLMAKETESLAPVEGVVEDWLKRDFSEEPGREFSVTLSRLQRRLRHQRIGILIDNLEPALDQTGRFIAPHRHYGELLRALTDPRNQAVTLITSRDRLCEAGITVEHYRLPGLTVEAWQTYWETSRIHSHPPTLKQIHQTYGGNAKAMQIIGGIIREDFSSDMQSYWQSVGHDPLQSVVLKNLVSGQTERLQRLDPVAYRLLCRLGCYRFQEHPTLPKSALIALLWDVDVAQQSYIIQSLRNRSLIEFQSGHYWLHPVIKAEAIARLKQGPDWEQAARHAAHYWTHCVTTIATVTDALKAWEAYYHYVEVQDFEAASQVILKSRYNQWQQYLPLGSLLYRMGLSQLVLTAIHQIIDHVKLESNLSELNNILGDLCWITGQIYTAIACQETSLATASHCLTTLSQPPSSSDRHQLYYFGMLKIDSLLSLGLYYLDLWDLEKAAALFQQVIELGQGTPHERWAEKASVCLALVQSYLGESGALALAKPVYQKVVAAQSSAYTGRFAYFIQLLGQTYANLGHLSMARTLYEKAIAFAQESHYKQIKAVAMSSLGELDRLQNEYETALDYHVNAVQLLEEIGAKCDWANAHVQWGITLKKLGQPATDHFEQAIQLFQSIQAPRQVERVEAIAFEGESLKSFDRGLRIHERRELIRKRTGAQPDSAPDIRELREGHRHHE